jgi:mono/diheme cytochrome c family protein
MSMFLGTVFLLLVVMGTEASAGKDLSRGQVAYLRRCAGCHGPQGRGDGPDAAVLGERPTDLRSSDTLGAYTDDDLVARVLDGQRLRLELRPAALREHAANVEMLYQFLRRLRDTPWEAVEAGEGVYFERCLACHGRYGAAPRSLPSGVRRPQDLAAPRFQSLTDSELAALARHGKDHMPALVPRLGAEEGTQVTAFLRMLSPGYELYGRYCANCHGARGEGSTSPLGDVGVARFAFDAEYFSKRSPEEVRGEIWHMLRDARPAMPHFSATLTKDELRQIIAYLRSLPADPPSLEDRSPMR